LRVIALLWLLGLAVSLLLIRTPWGLDAQAMLAACWVLAGCISLKGWRGFLPSRLQWDGQQWILAGLDSASALHLDLLMDFQNLMLVRVRGKSMRPVWLWLEPVLPDPQWLALRRAVVASQREPQPEITPSTSIRAGEHA
jgi:hypothetical protein